MNLCVFFKVLDQQLFPKEEQYHIRTRLDNSIVNISKDYNHLFDIENIKLMRADYENEIRECI